MSSLVREAEQISMTLNDASVELRALTLSSASKLSYISSQFDDATAHVKSGAEWTGVRVLAAATQASDVISAVDELGSDLRERISLLHEGVRGVHCALDVLERRVAALSAIQSSSSSPR